MDAADPVGQAARVDAVVRPMDSAEHQAGRVVDAGVDRQVVDEVRQEVRARHIRKLRPKVAASGSPIRAIRVRLHRGES